MHQRDATSAEVTALLQAYRRAGMRVDDRVFREVLEPGKLFLGKLEKAEEFLSLVWQSIDGVRPLAPTGQPRSLRHCALRLSDFGWRFDRLVELGYTWFGYCAEIDLAFDLNKLGHIALTDLVPAEARETPNGTYYIYDGVHRSIVLAKKLITQQTSFKPINFLLLTPRRS